MVFKILNISVTYLLHINLEFIKFKQKVSCHLLLTRVAGLKWTSVLFLQTAMRLAHHWPGYSTIWHVASFFEVDMYLLFTNSFVH